MSRGIRSDKRSEKLLHFQFIISYVISALLTSMKIITNHLIKNKDNVHDGVVIYIKNTFIINLAAIIEQLLYLFLSE